MSKNKTFQIALVGNPNCGKTTLFNGLTGQAAHVGNWPGVTVEKKEGNVRGHDNTVAIDLPGIYSLSPYTLEEVITRDFLTKEEPNAIINIVDAANLERNLYLTTQLIETGVPVVVALNMMDVVEKRGDSIDESELALRLGCPVVKTIAAHGQGFEQLVDAALKAKKAPEVTEMFTGAPHEALHAIQDIIADHHHTRYLAVKLFERDDMVTADMHLSTATRSAIDAVVTACESEMGDDAASIITTQRYTFVHEVAKASYSSADSAHSATAKIDAVLTHKYGGIPLFIAIIWTVYYISVSSLGASLTAWFNGVLFGTHIAGVLDSALTSVAAAPWLHSLVIDGLLGGVGAVLSFIPQLAILFFFLSVLEDSGYMARVAFIMDRAFRRIGLSGKSFIPLLVASGCGVPGIMATRTIENEKERKITIMVTTFIPCAAKLPVIALIAGAFFPGKTWVAPSVYFLGFGMVILSGLMLKGLKIFMKDDSPFVMELPDYHLPIAKNIASTVWDRTSAFIVKAGTLIFVASGLIWVLSSFNFAFHLVETSRSMLAAVGSLIAPIFVPLGFGNWQAAVATITGLVAKETIVSTLSVLTPNISSVFTPASAYAFLVFNMLCAPCVAAIGAIRREMGNLKWTAIAVGYQMFVAYAVALIVYQGSRFMAQGIVNIALVAVISVLAVGAMIKISRDRRANPCLGCTNPRACAGCQYQSGNQ